jgi:hypothetical protein
MRSVSLLILSILCGQVLVAQYKLTGKVVDARNRLPLPDATVTIMNPADSATVGFAVADKTGLFEIKNIVKGSFLVDITFTGYSGYHKKMDFTGDQLIVDLDTVFMQMDTTMLAGVVVTAPPITVKKDTVEFRAASFKTKPNATVEDLLKKLPGVEVDRDGNITAQGEEITKIYVDGKEFFGNDPKLATKNLPSELIESIQVFDDMSDQAKFTRIDDGSRQRTINIKLKKNRKRGMFGRSSASLGNAGRYEGSGSVNMFDDSRQLSVLGGANNINRLGFSNNDLMRLANSNNRGGRGGRGGGGGGGGLGNGNLRTWSGGLNFRDEWGRKIQFAGHYFVSHTNNNNRTESYRQNVFEDDSVSYTNRKAFSKNLNTNHNIGLRFEYEIDSMNSILLTPTISISRAQSWGDDTLSTRAASPKFDYLAITGASHRSNQNNSESFGNNLLFRHRFNKPGRTFTIGWKTELKNGDGEGFNKLPYTFYNNDGTLDSLDNRDQQNQTLSKSFNNTVSSSLTEMLGSDNILELNYAYTVNKSISDRDTYEYNPITKEYDSINRPLTNYFRNMFTSSRLGTNFRVKREKYDFQAGGAVQFATIDNLSNRATTEKDSTMRQSYTNFFPNASFSYNPKPRTSLRFRYRGSTRPPSISQLQEVWDISNPLNIRTGNADLKQEFTHNFNISYNSFNLNNYVYVNFTLGASIVNNRIVNAISFIDDKIQLTRPENLNGTRNMNFSGTVGIPLKKTTTGRRSPLNLNLTTSLRMNRDVSKLKDQLNYNHTRGVGQRIRVNYFIDDKLDLGANASVNYNDARYSVRSDMNYKYFDYRYSLDLTYTVFKRIMINNDFDYYVNTGRAEGFNQSIPIWNAYISCLLFKKQNGEIRLNGIDLLNQNKSINRSVGDNYVEDTYTQVLQRFFLVSFMYNFNRFNGKAINSARRR